MKTTLLIDGNNIAMRNHFKLPYLKNSHGTLTGAIHGFLSTLLVVNRDIRPDKIVIAWDGGRSAWRKELYPEYKADRESTAITSTFRAQSDILRIICRSLNVTTLFHEGVEGDDMIADEVAKLRNNTAVIYSSDEDFLQLCDAGVRVLSPSGDKFISPEEKLGCAGWEHILAKSYAGDSSDNIKGLAGIGKKTALDMVRKAKLMSFSDFGKPYAMAQYANGGKRWRDITMADITDIVLRNYRMMSFDYAIKQLPKDIKPVVGKFDSKLLASHFNELELKRHSSNIAEFGNLCVPEDKQAF